MTSTGTAKETTGAWVTADLIAQKFNAVRDNRTSPDWTINLPELWGNYFTESARHKINRCLLGHGLHVVEFPTHPDGVGNGDVVLEYHPLPEDCASGTCSPE